MSLEQTIRDKMVSESADLDARLQQLVRAGLMPQNTLPLLRKAVAKVQMGASLQGPERDVMATFINSMMYIVLGDDTIFNKARAGAKTYATEAKEKQEYDYEGDMAMSQLKTIIANAQRMHDMLSDDTNLPEWVQSKLTLAEDYISTAANYLQGEMKEEVETIDELSRALVGRYSRRAKDEADYGNPLKSRAKGREMASRKRWGGTSSYVKPARVPATEETQIDELSDALLKNYSKKALAQSKTATGDQKLKRQVGARNAIDRLGNNTLAKEEAEQIDELSKATLGRYVKKSAERMSTQGVVAGLKIAKDEKSQNNFDTISKRSRGISTAVKKLTKEDIEAVKKMNESYKTAFDAALTEYGIKSPSELGEEKRRQFFKHVDQEFKKGDN